MLTSSNIFFIAFDVLSQGHVSEDAKDLIRKILVVDPLKRYNTDLILAHPWCKAEGEALSLHSLESCKESMGSMIFESLGAEAHPGPVDIAGIQHDDEIKKVVLHRQATMKKMESNKTRGAWVKESSFSAV